MFDLIRVQLQVWRTKAAAKSADVRVRVTSLTCHVVAPAAAVSTRVTLPSDSIRPLCVRSICLVVVRPVAWFVVQLDWWPSTPTGLVDSCCWPAAASDLVPVGKVMIAGRGGRGGRSGGG